MPNPYRRKRGRYRFLRGGGDADPLAIMDDAFAGTELDAKWSVFDDAIADYSVSGDELHATHIDGLGVGEALWYSGFDGFLIYQEVTGDFLASVDARITNDAGAAPTMTGYRIAGLQAHDPDRTSVRNYVHAGVGVIDAAPLQAEWKTTVDNESDSGVVATGAFDSIDWPSGAGRLFIQRVGDIFTVGIDATELLTVTRADLPATLQLGLTLYSNQPTPDAVGHFSNFTVRTPG